MTLTPAEAALAVAGGVLGGVLIGAPLVIGLTRALEHHMQQAAAKEWGQ